MLAFFVSLSVIKNRGGKRTMCKQTSGCGKCKNCPMAAAVQKRKAQKKAAVLKKEA
ncbi:hypothetical protein SD77_0735 [Bacillus badius]|uniref:FeoB-associated Cys-rich membrane protein n=1 Tax=Bacillus badius TaxID=1455 RepID=A0ABR5ATX6_BACBA|nr:hypothetical protein SD78_4019 [Bacillus badius]KIL78134.1 hypothetical protein SD77_0735 [Bacillus badius]